jgi:hypothetical protein
MKEKVEISGISGDCYLVGFSHASETDRANGILDPCTPLVEIPNYNVPQVILPYRIKTFVVVDAWVIRNDAILPIKVNFQNAKDERLECNYYFSEHNARIARDTAINSIEVNDLTQHNAFVMHDKLYRKGSLGWIVHKKGNHNMWITYNEPDTLRDVLNVCGDSDGIDITITYKGIKINGSN